eukprot:snap_masked-scaffold_36-processed-gene-0.37-mRNA-1 protein AED:1.00 eAED:1.00 QI:0/0/0/0/1/1/2/0/66
MPFFSRSGFDGTLLVNLSDRVCFDLGVEMRQEPSEDRNRTCFEIVVGEIYWSCHLLKFLTPWLPLG